MAGRTIKVDFLARVEGEGALTITFRRRAGGERRDGVSKDKEVRSVELKIFEPPRFFEAFLRGRSFLEVPDITARICGICPVAYQMSSCHALENALGGSPEGAVRDLRRLLYCGEWIESHALHVFLLHAPDFLGYEDAVAMARDHKEHVQRGLRIKKAGNAVVELVGGRAIHPVNVRVGGFYRAPSSGELRALVPELEWARDAIRAEALWIAGFRFPDFTRDYEFVALRHPSEYPMNEGRIASSKGIDIAAADFERTFEEYQVPHSTALQCRVRGRDAYFAGPLARFNLNFDRLSDSARALAREVGLEPPCTNPFRGILARAVETFYALDEALRIIARAERPERPFVEVAPRSAEGMACTEAPRGLLYHRYRIGDSGLIEEAKIVPPTSQNQLCIEGDLRAIGSRLVELPHAEATHLAEQTVRNYDPCISCSTHFIRLAREEER